MRTHSYIIAATASAAMLSTSSAFMIPTGPVRSSTISSSSMRSATRLHATTNNDAFGSLLEAFGNALGDLLGEKEMETDVLVVGSGISGSTTAFYLNK